MIDLKKIKSGFIALQQEDGSFINRDLSMNEIRMIYEIIEPDAANVSELFRTLMVYGVINELPKAEQLEINKWCKQFELDVDYNQTKINYVNSKFESIKVESNPKIYIKKLLEKELEQYNRWKESK